MIPFSSKAAFGGDRPPQRDRASLPAIAWACLASILLHALLLWMVLPRIDMRLLTQSDQVRPDDPLTVLLPPPGPPPQSSAPAPVPSTPPSPPVAPTPRPQAARPKPPPIPSAPKPAPEVLATTPSPEISPPPAAEAPVAVPRPVAPDLASLIESRRRAAGVETHAGPVSGEDERARANRVASANLGNQRMMIFGYDPNRAGGVFKIQRTGLNDGEFVFYGWNPLAGRSMPQMIEVKRGNNSDIRVAMVRKMVAMIRELVNENDFVWDSRRLGRSLVLSARIRDSAATEDFLMKEFDW